MTSGDYGPQPDRRGTCLVRARTQPCCPLFPSPKAVLPPPGPPNVTSRIAIIAALHLAAFAHHALVREPTTGRKAAFVLTWGFLNFAWLAVLRRPSLAAALSLAMIAVLILLVATQARRLVHDGQFRRRHDRRRRYDLLPVDGFPEPRRRWSASRLVAGGAGPGPGLAVRPLLDPAAHRVARLCGMLGRALAACPSPCRSIATTILERQLRIQVRALRRRSRSRTS